MIALCNLPFANDFYIMTFISNSMQKLKNLLIKTDMKSTALTLIPVANLKRFLLLAILLTCENLIGRERI